MDIENCPKSLKDWKIGRSRIKIVCRSMVIKSWDGRSRIAPSIPTFYDHRATILQLTTKYLNCYWDCVFKGFHASRKRTDMTASGWKEKSLIIHVRCVAWQQIGEGTWIYKCPTSSKFGNLLFVCTYHYELELFWKSKGIKTENFYYI